MKKSKGSFLFPLNDRDVLVKYDLVGGPSVEVVDVEFNAIPAAVAVEDLKPAEHVGILIAVAQDAGIGKR